MSPREIADCKVLAYRNLAEAYLLRSMVQKSIDIFKKVLVIRKADYKAMMRLGEVYELYIQDLEKAWSYYDAAVKIAPEAPGIHSLLGRLYSHPDFKSFDLGSSYFHQASRVAFIVPL
jgi:tetratricopeptide (TPR) repeat protein